MQEAITMWIVICNPSLSFYFSNCSMIGMKCILGSQVSESGYESELKMKTWGLEFEQRSTDSSLVLLFLQLRL